MSPEHSGIFEEFLHEPSILHFLYSLGIPSWIPEIVFFIPITGIILIIILRLGTSKPGKTANLFQTAVEWYVEWIKSICNASIKHNPEKYYCFIGSLHALILLMSISKIVPGFLSPTTDWRVPLSLAIISLSIVHVHGIKAHGFKNYLSHFSEGNIWLAPMMIPIHTMIELTALTTLTLRLYANIFMGHLLSIVALRGSVLLMEMAAFVIFGLVVEVPIPLPILFLPIEVFKAWLYSMVTTRVVLEYLGQMD